MKIKKILAAVLICTAVSVSAGCAEKSAEETQSATSAATAASTTAETAATTEEVIDVKAISEERTKNLTKDSKLVALTFDDGPSTTTLSVLAKLEKYGVTASFFVVGNNVSDNTQSIVERAYNMGCEINNHSKTHSYMNEMTAEEITEEIKYTSDKVEEITGEPTHFFRPPYIAVNQTMFDAIELPFICGCGSNDWDVNVTVEERSSKIIEQVKDASIILLHDSQGNIKTVEALDTLIPALLDDGYTFVTVSELFAVKEITPAEGIVYSNAYQETAY